MTDHRHVDDLDEFDQGVLEVLQRTPFVRLVYGLSGLTRLGEHPAPLDRLALVLGRSEDETTTLLRDNTTARIEDGLIHWDDPFPGDHVRRNLHIGDREVPMRSGCAPDLPLHAAVLDVPFRVEDTCSVTGTPIKIDFVPDGYAHLDPPTTVTVMLPLGDIRQVTGASFEQIDTGVCTHQPFFASTQAAAGWLQATPGGHVFTIAEMFERPWHTHFRDALRPFVHPTHRLSA
jgi:alkylmercury lyase